MISNSTRTLYIVVLTAFAFSLGLSLLFVLNNSATRELIPLNANAVAVYEQKKAIIVALPVRLKIPKINIDAPFEEVGLTKEGAMGVPQGPDGVAWFNLGPRPGEKGSSVVDGHSGWKNDIPAVFDDLYKLKKGDKIYVEDSKGVTTTFLVREVHTYKSKATVPNVFSSSDGKSHLNLITCTGVWNIVRKSHNDRLVVFAEKEI